MSAVLVIDDDPLVHHWFRRDFEDLDVAVLSAQSAREGLEMVSGRPVDVQQYVDGSILVSDDKAGAVYRISYQQ